MAPFSLGKINSLYKALQHEFAFRKIAFIIETAI